MSITHLNVPLLRATTRLRYQRYIRRSIKGDEHHTGLYLQLKNNINLSIYATLWWTGNHFFLRKYELKVNAIFRITCSDSSKVKILENCVYNSVLQSKNVKYNC